MATMKMPCAVGSGGASEIEYEAFKLTWSMNQTITIPTTKKARAIAFVSDTYGSNIYQMICCDGVNDNTTYMNANDGTSTSWGVKFDFNDNSIVSRSAASGNKNITVVGFILY